MCKLGFVQAEAKVVEIRLSGAIQVELKNGHRLFVKVPKDKKTELEKLREGDRVLIEVATADPTKGFLIGLIGKEA